MIEDIDIRKFVMSEGRLTGRITCILVDHFFMDCVKEEYRDLSAKVHFVEIRGPSTIGRIVHLRDSLKAYNLSAIVAIGGGTVLDIAKLLRAELAHPGILSVIRRMSDKRGSIRGLRLGIHQVPMLLVPSTFGTGSECNGKAVVYSDCELHSMSLVEFSDFGDVYVYYSSKFLQANVALEWTSVFEYMWRLAGVWLGSLSSSEDANQLLESRLRHLIQLIRTSGARMDISSLVTLARLSGDSHTTSMFSGRGRFPSPLWAVVSALSSASGRSKNDVAALLSEHYLDAVEKHLPCFSRVSDCFTDRQWGLFFDLKCANDFLLRAVGVKGSLDFDDAELCLQLRRFRFSDLCGIQESDVISLCSRTRAAMDDGAQIV